MNQWQVAALQPPHLAAMCVWEGASRLLPRRPPTTAGSSPRSATNWYDMQVKTVQYGLGERGPVNPNTGELVCGDETLAEAELAAQPVATFGGRDPRPPARRTSYYRERSADWDAIDRAAAVRRPTGAARACTCAATSRASLRAAVAAEVARDARPRALDALLHRLRRGLQKRFFDHFLKGEDTGWQDQPPRPAAGPPRRRRLHRARRAASGRFGAHAVDHASTSTSTAAPSTRRAVGRRGQDASRRSGDGLTFTTAPLDDRDRDHRPGRRSSSSSPPRPPTPTSSLIVRVFDPDGQRGHLPGRHRPAHARRPGLAAGLAPQARPRAQRASTGPGTPTTKSRTCSPASRCSSTSRSWPTSIVIPAGYRIALTVQGRDYEYAKHTGARLSNFKNELLGCGPFLHNDPDDRPADIYGGTTTVHADDGRRPWVLLPVVPPR